MLILTYSSPDNNIITGAIPPFFSSFDQLLELRLQKNEITSGAEFACEVRPPDFWADCLPPTELAQAELTCPCCTRCYSDDPDAWENGNGLPPANDECEGAEGPLRIGSITEGSTKRTRVDKFPGGCNGVFNTAGGVWFVVQGTGQVFRARACGSPSSFEPQISIFQGGSCAGLQCVGAHSDACENGVSWDTAIGEPYRILVHGFGDRSGDFTLTLANA